MDGQSKQPVVTFYSKQEVVCPVCGTHFPREELLTGGGRMIAGDLTDELRRNYEPSVKFGVIYPVMYSVGVCPKCCYAVFWNDFNSLDAGSLDRIDGDQKKRMDSAAEVFPGYDFHRRRTLFDGAAACYLALLCYEKTSPDFSPTVKSGILCLRAAWLSDDLDKMYPGKNFDIVSLLFYKKAIFYYNEALVREQAREELITNIKSYGPDTDKNYGYDGVIYLSGLLEYKYGQTDDPSLRLKKLDAHKRAIARIFGLGKSSKNKPGPLLEHSRRLYDNLSAEIKGSTSIDVDDDE